ncbi:hypothetical protein Pint_17846 [Pistacia integerrima]|uniref:Uncharacterized protein n=1 Tax=Pistacia integerrima TaxID=434235 RepID=A0ACC0YVC5_9ROSI|nr:hypothetical protein Pint_17846 [Pistacia integerrima]
MTTNHQDNQNHGQNGLQVKEQEVVVVMVPFPAQGHLNQLLQLSRLVSSYNIPVHYVGTASHNLQAKVRVHGWNPLNIFNIHFHDFEIPPFVSSPPDANGTCKFPPHLQTCFNASKQLGHPLAQLLVQLSSTARKVIVIHDSLMGSVLIQEVRVIPNVESYCFHSVSAFSIYLYIWESMGKSIDVNDAIPKDIPSLEDCFTKEFLDSISSEYDYRKFNSGNVYNTCRVIESAYMDLLDRETMDWAHRQEIVTSNMVETAVTRLMASKEGDEMRNRAAELGRQVRQSMREGGVSCTEFNSFVAHITR